MSSDIKAVSKAVQGVSTVTAIETVSYAPPAPRCSLDFAIHISEDFEIDDTLLRLQSFKGSSQVSQPFEYQLELRANDSSVSNKLALRQSETKAPKDYLLSVANLLGKSATVSLELPITDTARSAGKEPAKACINGIISSFSMVDAGVYQASLKPALWRLSLANDYKLYAGKTIKDVIQSVVSQKHGVDCDLSGLDGLAVARKQDWLQAGETDLQFISRLMDKVNIYYYFVHQYGCHTAVFANKPKYHPVKKLSPSGEELNQPLELYYTYSKVASLEDDSLILAFSYKQDLTTSKIRSCIAEPQAAWEHDSTATLANFASDELSISDQIVTAADAFQQYQIFQYGSDKSEADDYAKTNLAKLQTSASSISGQCGSPELKPGYLFVTRQHKEMQNKEVRQKGAAQDDADPLAVLDMRPEFDKQPWVVTQVSESADATGPYQCQFSATIASGQIANFGLSNTHVGSVLAVVTSAPDDQAQDPQYLHYLAKNNFSYDIKRFDSCYVKESKDQYSCKGVYVKFTTGGPNASPTWVKLAPHMQTVPEIGVVVLVARSQDDSEIPEIQSIVQAKGNKNINPNGAADNTSVGDNYSTSYGDSHSIRFGKKSKADLEKARKIITDQYSTGKFKDVSYSQGAGFSYSTAENGAEGLLSHGISYGSTVNYYKGATTESHSTTTDISKSYAAIKRSVSSTNIGSATLPGAVADSLYAGYASYNINNITGDTYSQATTTGKSINHQTITGESKNVSKLGSSHNTTTIDSGSYNKTTLTGGSYNWSSTDTANSINIMGASVNTSVTGANNSVSVTGAQGSQSVTGVTANVSVTGMANSINYTGINNSVNISTVVNAVELKLTGAGFTKIPSVDARMSELRAELGDLKAKIMGMDTTL